MKRNLLKFHTFAAVALALSVAGLASAQTTNISINAFTSGTAGAAPSGGGTEWGDGTILWDNSQLYPGTTGSGYIAAGFSATDTTGYPVNEYICYPGDNWYYYNNSGPALFDLSQYSAIQFQILWDKANSSMTVDQFNSPATIPGAAYGTSSYAGLEVGWTVAVLATNFTYVTNGTVITTNESTYWAGNGNGGFIGDYNIPDAASNGWATMTIPIPNTLNNTAHAFGIVLAKWIANETSTPATAPTAYFWIGNVQLIGSAAPPPPPTLHVPTKTTPGLNVIASTDGNTYYDRQEVGLVASNGVSWVGHDLTSPVTYSFTINGFPQNPATFGGCEAYMMMAPNPAAYDNAIDWNEPDCVVLSLQQHAANSTVLTFEYKINSPSANANVPVGTVTNTGTALGTWSVTLTSDTNVTLTAPDGNTSSFVFTNASYFAETANPGMYLYLGMQANNAASLDQAVCYSQFSISGVPAAISDNFLTDSTLNATNWLSFMGSAPNGVFVMPPGAEDWESWTLPAAGFQLQAATSISGPWKVCTGRIVGEVAGNYQLITTNDVPAGSSAAFFEMANP